ncbi:MAG TPA: hypothetical protein VGX50_07310, partial [Longimicrobium sp.]|nr:hypothetical protein [Longimicrobium sp.]
MRSVSLVAAALVLAACASPRPNYPVTRTATPIPAWNEAVRGSAPNVAAGVTGDRIARARGEPQNWLTYYGAYDGQRYSTLDQIDAGNVSRLRPAWNFQFAPVGLIATPATYSFEAAPIV